MIVYLATEAHPYTIRKFVRSWAGPRLRWRIAILPWERLPRRRALPRSAYVFSDLERLTPEQLDGAAALWDWLAEHRSGVRLLNDPRKALWRHALLGKLHREGTNDFRSFRPSEPRDAVRYPVFVRSEREHDGSLTPRLHDRESLDRAIAGVISDGKVREELLIVEFTDTSDGDGLYRKYSAFRAAGRIIPRQLLFGDRWEVKEPQIVDADKVREERAYLESNPHAEAIEGIFRLAGIDYGRIDYGVRDGRIQTFEINTNPVVMSKSRRHYKPARRPAQVWFADRFREALRDLADSARARSPADLIRAAALPRRRRSVRD